MCEDAQCTAACKPRVLREDQPRRMGVAEIWTMACLAHTDWFCTACSERWPSPGAIEGTAGNPRIRKDLRNECVVCSGVCPATTDANVALPFGRAVSSGRSSHRAAGRWNVAVT